MKVEIHKDGKHFWVPAPLWLGQVVLRIISIDGMTREQQREIIKIIGLCKQYFKAYKGLNIVEVQTAKGDHISITI